MMQCPQCGHRVFEAGLHLAASVRITALDNGDYDEQEIESYNRDWVNLQCARCERYCNESDAHEAFDVATLSDGVTDDIYEFYEARQRTMPTAAEDESVSAIAGAWNFWLWQQERKGASA
jgi:sarcosine oxidase delta subunit